MLAVVPECERHREGFADLSRECDSRLGLGAAVVGDGERPRGAEIRVYEVRDLLGRDLSPEVFRKEGLPLLDS